MLLRTIKETENEVRCCDYRCSSKVLIHDHELPLVPSFLIPRCDLHAPVSTRAPWDDKKAVPSRLLLSFRSRPVPRPAELWGLPKKATQ